ncbi:Sulfatase-modifying factor 2, partial [Pteropus alecto]
LLSFLSCQWIKLGNGQVTSMVQLPGGRFQMGTNSLDGRDEGPVREVTVKLFAINLFPVTNKDSAGQIYPWGNQFQLHRTNLWQGKFPKGDKAEDGFHGVSPVNDFPPQNNYGLYDLMGDVWEWTASPYQNADQDMHVLQGGSWINTSDGSANHQAWVTTRMGNTPDSASDNLGFRCASSFGQLPGEL